MEVSFLERLALLLLLPRPLHRSWHACHCHRHCQVEARALVALFLLLLYPPPLPLRIVRRKNSEGEKGKERACEMEVWRVTCNVLSSFLGTPSMVRPTRRNTLVFLEEERKGEKYTFERRFPPHPSTPIPSSCYTKMLSKAAFYSSRQVHRADIVAQGTGGRGCWSR